MDETLISHLAQKNHEAHKYAAAFRLRFGVSLVRYWNPVTGFDLLRLESDLKVPLDASMEDWITEHKGAEAAELVRKLIGI